MSRNAEALFWIGRYMERAENHARLIHVYYHVQDQDRRRLSDGSGSSDRLCKWGRVVDALGSRAAYEEQFGDAYGEREAVWYVTFDRNNPNSLASCVSYARGNVRTLREKLPVEAWEATNGFYLWLQGKEYDDIRRDSPHQFFARIKEWTALFQGALQSVMPRENEWYFMECGRYLERTENTLRILRSAGAARDSLADEGFNAEEEGYPFLQAVLRSVSGYLAFRRYYADGFTYRSAMEFLLLNTVFPRSVLFSIRELHYHLRSIRLQDKPIISAHNRMIRQVVRLKSELDCLEPDDLVHEREQELLAYYLKAVRQLEMAFSQTFFRIGEASA